MEFALNEYIPEGNLININTGIFFPDGHNKTISVHKDEIEYARENPETIGMYDDQISELSITSMPRKLCLFMTEAIVFKGKYNLGIDTISLITFVPAYKMATESYVNPETSFQCRFRRYNMDWIRDV